MKDNWNEALTKTFSSDMDKNSVMNIKQGKLEFVERGEWMDAIFYPSHVWGYYTTSGWRSVDKLSVFPPMTDGFQEQEWFDPYKYAELLYVKMMRIQEFIGDNPSKKYELVSPELVDNNVVYFQVMNLNSKWSSFSNKWTYNVDMTIFINGMIYPVVLTTRGLVKLLKEHKILEIGTKITPSSIVKIENFAVTI